MKVGRQLRISAAMLLFSVGAVFAQGAIGGEDNQITESRMPTVVTVDIADVNSSSFPVNIPFSMTGSAATVYLAVYTNLSDSELPGLTTRGEINWHTYQEVNYALHVSAGSRFEAGSHSLSWDGTDIDGNAVDPSGSYRYYVIALDDQAPINMVAYTNARHTAESALARDGNGDLFTLVVLTSPVRLTSLRWGDCNDEYLSCRGHYGILDFLEQGDDGAVGSEIHGGGGCISVGYAVALPTDKAIAGVGIGTDGDLLTSIILSGSGSQAALRRRDIYGEDEP